MSTSNRDIAVAERGKTRAFVTMVEWPGWSRGAKTEDQAVETVLNYADRYRQVVERAGISDLPTTVDIIDRLPGDGQTDFGVPGQVHAIDHEPLDDEEASRLIDILGACWLAFDDVRDRVSPEMKKGPRGGGRDRDPIVEHVVEADRGYARRIGVRTPPFDVLSTDARRDHSAAVYEVLMQRRGGTTEGKEWPMRYALRRMAWHILDHTWEMEDKDLSRSANGDA